MNQSRRVRAADQAKYHNAPKGTCCKARLFLLPRCGARLWGSGKEKVRRVTGLPACLKSQDSVTEKAPPGPPFRSRPSSL